ncbi:protein SHI RELATED SEQUENCE 5-like [Andrographis paniculata]|uniref:protein SHI RELATED SEQUENCE 5-like n=1 Tax=Andrographis paniculata TaxID=175694 RepID=UPI0021E88C19|nr:protein SHI RELATED SEQUENCE 5-like [Andrographis paniculata]XP_051151014.1 protein SHI RELATED SEQUENCE 5-like [Andrographis paniculata]XP_051151016.1 protein SHI RELATED SEQUENCE 5-like [Andrographis paniculata]XP_051151017.1 protein SHI RELATED SEQUENCE 5-like [Andrographis paniculata]
MSGFFSLGGKDHHHHHHHHHHQDQQHHLTESSSNLFQLSKNVEVYNKGFELWQQYYQLHQQQRIQTQHHSFQDLNFSAGPSSDEQINNSRIIGGGGGGGGGGGCGFGDEHSNYYYRSSGIRVMNQAGGGGSGSYDGFNCQDCGNRAKKDCVHMRCRTCCKNRGFQCQTHVKSTWVPAAKRRERQSQHDETQLTIGEENPKRMTAAGSGGGGGGGGGGGFEVGQFPPELHSPADFTLVRVSSIDGAEEHLAYQTAVNIGGHVFKGILYDRGPESRYPGGGGGGESSSGGGGGSQQQPLDPTASSTSGVATSTVNPSIMDPSIYPPHHQLGGFMAGTQFFLPPRP